MERIKIYLKNNLSEHRYIHSLAVADCARKLARVYSFDEKKAYLAGLIHDCGKGKEKDFLSGKFLYPIKIDKWTQKILPVLHSKLGAVIAKEEFHIDDKDILNAIAYHTTGRFKMSDLECIIYLADMIEPNRTYPRVEILREAATKGLYFATLLAMDFSIQYLMELSEMIHPDTIQARNTLLEKVK